MILLKDMKLETYSIPEHCDGSHVAPGIRIPNADYESGVGNPQQKSTRKLERAAC